MVSISFKYSGRSSSSVSRFSLRMKSSPLRHSTGPIISSRSRSRWPQAHEISDLPAARRSQQSQESGSPQPSVASVHHDDGERPNLKRSAPSWRARSGKNSGQEKSSRQTHRQRQKNHCLSLSKISSNSVSKTRSSKGRKTQGSATLSP